MRTLDMIGCGETVRVVAVHGGGPLRRRILDMGITKGSDIKVENVAPLGDPIEIIVRGYKLSIRKGDAVSIEVAGGE
ncbi:MAG: ferrous iron transport protein A [Thermoplasmatales archaeon]|nr:ferrous iron transport protein A [Thermoplasmatales archaeon]